VKPSATRRNSVSRSNSRRHRYTKVVDNRKHPIRGLWKRNGSFLARIAVEDDLGHKSLKWVPLEAETAAEAQEEFRSLLVQRSENRLRPIGLSPLLRDYGSVYLERQATSGKKPDTLVTERGHINKWIEAIGHLRLDKILSASVAFRCHKAACCALA
jgi:hypothetical protein